MSKSNRRLPADDAAMTCIARATKKTVKFSEENRKARKLHNALAKRQWNEDLIS